MQLEENGGSAWINFPPAIFLFSGALETKLLLLSLPPTLALLLLREDRPGRSKLRVAAFFTTDENYIGGI